MDTFLEIFNYAMLLMGGIGFFKSLVAGDTKNSIISGAIMTVFVYLTFFNHV